MKKIALVFCILTAVFCAAADSVLTWPTEGAVQLRFAVGKLSQVKAYSGQADYLSTVVVTNEGAKSIPFASFYVYLLDKKGTRIGEGYIEVSNLAPGQQAKVPLTAHATGNVASMKLEPQHLPSEEPVKVTTFITSVPAGAAIKLDGQDVGVTPITLKVSPGKHEVGYAREGYTAGITSVEIAAGSPGSINLELVALSQDTVILRDGSEVVGDVTSVTASSVVLRVKGKARTLDRNRVARVLFADRKPAKRASRK